MEKREYIETKVAEHNELSENERNSNQILSDKAQKFVSLIVKIIVNATIRKCNEKGDKISEVQ